MSEVNDAHLGWRFFTIPGNGSDEWDPEKHGLELKGDDDPRSAVSGGDCAEIAWKPGFYEFTFGSSGSNFVLDAPEPPDQKEPSQKILRGFHEFLKVTFDEFV